MRDFAYPVHLVPEAHGRFTARFADLPEAITSGENRIDVLLQAQDCLDEAIAGRIADGLDIPLPSAARARRPQVSPSAAMAAKAALYLAIREAGLSNKQLARRLHVDEKEVRRMLNPRHPTKLPRIEQALHILGKRLFLTMSSHAA